MFEVGGAIVAGVFLLWNTKMNRDAKKDMHVKNGHKPGFLIEDTHRLLTDHITNQKIHNPPEE